jgi:hypothetical protein
MLKLRKLLKLPSPVDLGWSDCDALQSREFTPDCDGYTWEDWHDTVKSMHPIKYFIAETFGDFLRYKVWLRISRPFSDVYYWFVSHFVPSRRYHMLDLRQPCSKGDLSNFDCYRYGWTDVPQKMLYAWFNLLKEYLEEEPYDLTKDYTLEQINADVGMKMQHESLQEAKLIHRWWTVDLKKEYKTLADIRHQWSELRQDKAAREKGDDEKFRVVMTNVEKELEDKTDEMLMRLIKLRRSLWT